MSPAAIDTTEEFARLIAALVPGFRTPCARVPYSLSPTPELNVVMDPMMRYRAVVELGIIASEVVINMGDAAVMVLDDSAYVPPATQLMDWPVGPGGPVGP